MAEFTHRIENWSNGIVQAVDGDRVPDTALLGAKNTQFWKNASGDTIIGTRSGLRHATEFSLGTLLNPRIHALIPYNYASSDNTVHTRYLAVVNQDGRLMFKEQDDSWDGTYLTPPAGYPSAATCIPADQVAQVVGTVMNGRLLLLAGPVARSLKGKTYQPFGLAAPGATATLTPTIGGTSIRLPADTYTVWVTVYNSDTGAESNPTLLGDFTTDGGSNGLIEVTLATSGVLADKWRMYVQRQSTQAQAYLLTDVYTLGDAQKSSDGNIAVADATVVVNVSAAVLADLITPVPDLFENNPIPTDVVYMTTFGRRLVAASRRKLYWSKLDNPDAFPVQNFENFSTDDGSEITGIVRMSDELLVVFTTTGTYGVFGLDPQYWTVKPIDVRVGCAGQKSIVSFDGGIGWWSPQFGPVIMRGTEIEKIGLDLLGPSTVTPFMVNEILSGWDPETQTIVWAVPGEGEIVNTKLLPFNYRVNRWCATEWDPLVVRAMATAWDANGNPRLFVADFVWSLLYFDKTQAFDGRGSSFGTVTGTFTAGSSTLSGFSGTGFYAGGSGNGLVGHMVSIVDSSGQLVGRTWIVSQTSTTSILLGRSLLVTNGATYTYYISTPYLELTSGWIDAGEPFARKRFDRLYVDFESDLVADLLISIRLNRNALTVQQSLTVAPDAASTGTTDATWDTTVTTSTPMKKKRLNVWKNGHNAQWTLSQPQPVPVRIRRVMMTGRVLSDRYYA